MTTLQYVNDGRVHSQLTFYGDRVKLFTPIVPIAKGSPKLGSPTRKKLTPEEAAEQSLIRSIERTKQKIREYAYCNKFTLFATFTFRENRHNDGAKIQQMKTWLDNQRKRNGKFSYVIVPEKHKDGAYHFHALIGGYEGRILAKKLGNGTLVYKLASYTLGISDVKYIKAGKRSISSTASYLAKYITKDMPLITGKKRYWCSQNLQKPTKFDNPPAWVRELIPVWEKRSDHGHVAYLDYTSELEELREISMEHLNGQ